MPYDMPNHRDDGQCHNGCWQRAIVGDQEYAFLRDAYLNLADEFDPMGTDPRAVRVTVDDFDPQYVEAAEVFARMMGIPFPWNTRSIDVAAVDVTRAERREWR